MSMQVGSSGGVRADINVTPLIDVVLVLLIIFMVVTPMLTKGYPVPLPRGLDPAKKPDDQKDIILSITETKEYYLSIPKDPDKSALSEAVIEQKLREIQDRGDAGPMYIKAAKSIDYGTVKKAMLLCETVGFKSVSLVAEAPQ